MAHEILKIMTDNGAGKEPTPFHNIEITEYNFTPTRMGSSQLTGTVMFAKCLDKEWTQKEFVTINGERYYIRQTPTSSKSNTDERYKHEITFKTEREELLGNVYFYDTVYFRDSFAGDKPVANSTIFTFYGNIQEFVDRLNCAFRYAGIGDSILKNKTTLNIDDKPVGDGYCAVFDPYGGYDTELTKEISVSDQYIADVITSSYNEFEIPYKYDGKRIIFGSADIVVEHIFKYGANNELLSVTKTNNNAKVINKISFKGSSENIPYYYPNETEYGHIVVHPVTTNSIITENVLSLVKPSLLVAKTEQEAENPIELVESQSNTPIYASSTFGKLRIIPKPECNNSKLHTNRAGLNDEITPDNWYVIEQNPDPYLTTWVEFDINFKTPSSMDVEITDIQALIWRNTDSQPVRKSSNILSSYMRLWLYKEADNTEILADKWLVNGVFNLGFLMAGSYRATIQFPMFWAEPNRSFLTYIGLRNATIGSGFNSTAIRQIHWRQGDKTFATSEQLGIKLDLTTEQLQQAASAREKIYWTAVDRLPFQTNLMPSIYRQSNGTQRFYEALNDTYIDPDTGEYYEFENPYIEGNPVEYIYTDEDIKPTIEGVMNNHNQLFGEIADIAYDDDDNDSLKATADEENDADSTSYEHSFFYIKLNIFNGEYGFDLFDSASQTDAMTLQMISGSCNGCKFKIQAFETTDNGVKVWKNPVQTTGVNGDIVGGSYDQKINTNNIQPWQQNTKINSIWICVQKDAETFGVIMPNQTENYKPQIGDKFNIINIDLPLGYIEAAEERGTQEAIRYMADNNEEKFNFSISASRIFFGQHPEILVQITENSKIKVEYDNEIYELYISSLTYNYKTNEPLPDIQINLTDSIAVGQNFVQKVSDRAASLIANAYTLGGAIGGSGSGMSVALAERRYLNKQKADRTPYQLSSDTGFEIGNFMSGNSGGIFYIDPETGQSHIEIDQLRVRMKAIFEELMIQQVDTIGGELIISAGGAIKVTAVENVTESGMRVRSWRCYFKSTDEEKQIECKLKVGDHVMCKQSNIVTNESGSSANRYYWLSVTSINNEEGYITVTENILSINDSPLVGDVICHLGNDNDTTRQSAIVLSTTNEFAPCVTLYHGINRFSLTDKAVIEYGVDKTSGTPQPFFNCYGRMFFGDKGRASYIQFDPTAKMIEFKGRIDVDSYVAGDTFGNYIASKVDDNLEDLEIGARNLLRNTKAVRVSLERVGFDWTTFFPDMSTTVDLVYGQTYVIRAMSNGVWTSDHNPAIESDFVTLWLWSNDSNYKKVSDEKTGTIKGTKFIWDKPSGKYYIRFNSYGKVKNLYNVMLVRGDKITTEWIEAPEDWDYMTKSLLNATTQSTTISGGLILSSLIALGQQISDGEFKVMSGLNGLYDSTKTGNGIAFWAGGEMVDAEDAQPDEIPATAVIRMDGTGYMAGNTIRFKSGQVELGDNLVLDDNSLSLMEGNEERVRITNENVPANLTADFSRNQSLSGNATNVCRVYNNGVITSEAGTTIDAVVDQFTISGLHIGDTVNITVTVTIQNAGISSSSSYARFIVDGSQISPSTFTRDGANLTVTKAIKFTAQKEFATINIRIDRGTIAASDSYKTATILSNYSGILQGAGAAVNFLGNDGLISSWKNTLLGVNQTMAVIKSGNYGIQVHTAGISVLWNGVWRNLTVGSDGTLKLGT